MGAPRLVLVDAHAHFHACFDGARFCEAARRNFQHAAAEQRIERSWLGMLLLADMPEQDSIAALRNSHLASKGLSLSNTGENGSWLVKRESQVELIVIAGQQLVSREDIEVLSLATPHRLPERLPLTDYPKMIQESQGLCVLPWGFGKWWSTRGRHVRNLLERTIFDDERQIFLGDNGLRPAFLPKPRMFRHPKSASRILAGSDPLPFVSHTGRIGSYGFAIEAQPDLQHPARWLRSIVSQSSLQRRGYGQPTALTRFVQDQVAMQLRKAAAL